MSQRRYTPEQIISKLREAEVELGKGATVTLACKKIGVTEQTYYRWRAEYGGLRLDQANNSVQGVGVPVNVANDVVAHHSSSGSAGVGAFHTVSPVRTACIPTRTAFSPVRSPHARL